jgi:hypothetical protein
MKNTRRSPRIALRTVQVAADGQVEDYSDNQMRVLAESLPTVLVAVPKVHEMCARRRR